MNKAIIYARENELCDRIIICHVHLPHTVLPPGFCTNLPLINIENINVNKNVNVRNNVDKTQNKNEHMKMIEIANANTNTNTNANTPITSPDSAHVHFQKNNIALKLFDVEDNKCSEINENLNIPITSKSPLKLSRIHGSGVCSPSGMFGSGSYSNEIGFTDLKDASPLSVS